MKLCIEVCNSEITKPNSITKNLPLVKIDTFELWNRNLKCSPAGGLPRRHDGMLLSGPHRGAVRPAPAAVPADRVRRPLPLLPGPRPGEGCRGLFSGCAGSLNPGSPPSLPYSVHCGPLTIFTGFTNLGIYQHPEVSYFWLLPR
jgi:hypothetical protein